MTDALTPDEPITIGAIVTTPEEFAALPYGTVLWDDNADPEDALNQIDGMGYSIDTPPIVVWDRHDRWRWFHECPPLRIIYIPTPEVDQS